MLSLLMVALPLLFAALAPLLRKREQALFSLLPLAGVCLCLLSGATLLFPERDLYSFYIGPNLVLATDATNSFFLQVTSGLFLAVAIHAFFWLPTAQKHSTYRAQGIRIMHRYLFVMFLLAFVSMMNLSILAAHFGLMWVAIEATTLASAPLILFYCTEGALEAMWKYLLICSLGIGLALFGILLLAYAGKVSPNPPASLSFADLIAAGTVFHPVWYKLAFVFCLAGFGTKMGLAPFHTWLPDAHSEAPAPISALLSGALLNCCLLAIIRVLRLAPEVVLPLCKTLLAVLGTLSVLVAAFLIIRQRDFKRMLAYSSIEHMGLCALLLCYCQEVLHTHVVAHSITKMMLFLLAGNILVGFNTTSVRSVTALFTCMPRTGILWLFGLFAICGTPPSPLFVTEFILIANMPPLLSFLILVLLLIIFAGMSATFISMTTGTPLSACAERESALADADAERLTIVPGAAALTILTLGFIAISWMKDLL
ncbi:MAG: NADH dehydrogenase FAD-containing subunit [Lentisphaerae bacterium]|nr:NADH dehydrogenase FAD-containing subunit [Lentisphaerota bacterium]OQC12304.1 MAG: Hydrogenase-4 component B [Lentisphaerae bacterium ADurb.Bin082]